MKQRLDFDFFELAIEKRNTFVKQAKQDSSQLFPSFKGEKIKLTGDIPQARNDHRIVQHNNKLALIGGTTENEVSFTTYSLDLEKGVWKGLNMVEKSQDKKPLSGMAGSAKWSQTIYPHLSGYGLMFGGWLGREYSDCLYLVNLNTMEMKSMRKESYHYSRKDAKQFKEFGSIKQAASVGNSKDIERYQAYENPPRRKDASLCYVPSENKMYLYGGWQGTMNTGSKQQLWILSSTWKWERYAAPSRRGHTCTPVDAFINDGINGFYIFGGFKGIKVASNQVMLYDAKLKKWKNIQFNQQDILPSGRGYHTANLYNNKIIMIGGMDDQFKILEDIWIFDITKKVWNKSSLPIKQRGMTRRAGHQTFMIGSSKFYSKIELYLLGGMTYVAEKRQFMRIAMDEMVMIDFKEILGDVKKEVMVSKEKEKGKGLGSVKHNMEHHWDVTQFGFPMKKIEEQMKDLYQEFSDIGITEEEMS